MHQPADVVHCNVVLEIIRVSTGKTKPYVLPRSSLQEGFRLRREGLAVPTFWPRLGSPGPQSLAPIGHPIDQLQPAVMQALRDTCIASYPTIPRILVIP